MDRRPLALRHYEAESTASLLDELPAKKGSLGTEVELVSNFVPIDDAANTNGFTAFQYLCDWTPRINDDRRRRFIRDISAKEAWGGYTYDANVLYLRHPIGDSVTNQTFKYSLAMGRKPVTLLVKCVGKVLPNTADYFHLLNVILKEAQRRLGLKQIHKDFFDMEKVTEVIQFDQKSGKELTRLKVAPGFCCSIGASENAAKMICCDVSFRMMTCDSVASLVKGLLQTNDSTDLNKTLQEMHNRFVGIVVYTEYNNRTWRIDELAFNISIKDSFECQERGVTIKKTYEEYFRERYNLRLKDPDQPMVMTRPKKKDLHRYHHWRKAGGKGELKDEVIYLPSELCFVTGLTENQRSDFQFMQKISQFTRQTPQDRITNLKKLAERLMSDSNCVEHFRDWGLQIQDRPFTIPAREMAPVPILMTDSRSKKLVTVPQNPTGNWDMALRNRGLNPTCEISNWVMVFFKRNEALAREFLECMRRVSAGMNCILRDPKMAPTNGTTTSIFLDEIVKNIKGSQIMFVLLPRCDANLYNAIKKTCYIDYPVNCQCVISRTLLNAKRRMSIASKVLLQMACKLGYSAWVSPIHPRLQTAMVVGIDVFHKRKQASVQAAVFSYNKEFTQYYSSAIVSTMSTAEVNPRLGGQFEFGLQNFRRENEGRLPDRIIVYRDGVGDSMLQVVLENEVAAACAAVKRVYERHNTPLPHIVMVVVKKRINTRLFLRDKSGRHGNANPGTVVDSVITKPMFCDFFLVSQLGRRGTITPTHYNKIFDNYKEADTKPLPPDILQRLTQVLTHLYYNWPGSIRVPAPTHYAHRLASLVGQSIGRVPDPRLCDRLFYL